MTNKNRILIVDDEEGLRESFNLILSDKYNLDFADNALKAMDMITQSPPDLVILDIKMPKLNGLEALKQVKKTKPDLPVIIVTGYQSAEMAKDAVRAGAADYIPKPFESKDILNAVTRILR